MDRLLATHSKIFVDFNQVMKKFLKLFSCTKATDIDSATFRSSQQNDVDLRRKIEEQITFVEVKNQKIEQEEHDREIALFVQGIPFHTETFQRLTDSSRGLRCKNFCKMCSCKNGAKWCVEIV